jgi:hypothetical protein
MYASCGLKAFLIGAAFFSLVVAQIRPKVKAEDVEYVVDHDVADIGQYSCRDIASWVRKEKHYSNDEVFRQLEALMHSSNCSTTPSLQFISTAFVKHGSTFIAQNDSSAPCKVRVKRAVILLSNFSINHNFSHFLHALLRLFCALLDARLIIWDRFQKVFVKRQEYSIWLDEKLSMDATRRAWLEPLLFDKDRANSLIELKTIAKNTCASAETLIYGSGCVKLLPPEKWFGYGGCRAHKVRSVDNRRG